MNKLLYKLLRWSGLPFLFRHTVQSRRVTIWMLHDWEWAAAEQGLEWLSRHYHIISLREYLDARRDAQSWQSLPRRAAVLTMDDGLAGNYQLLPLFRKYGIRPSIFLCSGIVGTRRHYWFLRTPSARLKALPNAERLRQLQAAGFEPEQEYAEPQALDDLQVEAMSSTVDFQSHTIFHPCLPTCTATEAWEEINGSREALQQRYGIPVYALAYPNGDYGEREARMAKAAGYECALTVEPGYNGQHTGLFCLKRLSLNDTGNMDELIVKASGCWGLLKKLLKAD